MNFTDAVRELAEGRCEGIKRALWGMAITKDEEGRIWLPTASFLDERDILADDWQLVNPKPIMEEVEVVRYVVILPDGGTVDRLWQDQGKAVDYAADCLDGGTVVPVPVKYSRPVAKKVKRRKEVSRAYCTIGSQIIPDDARFFAEWES